MATKDQIEKAWENAKKARGLNTDLYRKDPNGDIIFKPFYEKNSDKGWKVDYITPKSKGGSDDVDNLQVLKIKDSGQKGDSYKKSSRRGL